MVQRKHAGQHEAFDEQQHLSMHERRLGRLLNANAPKLIKGKRIRDA